MVSPGQRPCSLPVEPANSSSIPSGSSFKTPPQTGERVLDDTPPNHRTACIAEYQIDTTIDCIKEDIAEDLQKTEECGMETMLQAMLRIIAQKTNDSTENQQWAETALQQCLDAASNFVEQSDNGYTQDLRSGIRAYCDATTEGDRHTGTVSALNAIICQFRSDANQQALPVELRVPEEKLAAIFAVNDPRIIEPDVIQLDWKTARMLNGEEHVHDSFEDTVLLANARPKPKEQSDSKLRWYDVLMAFELKKKKSLKSKVIPAIFESQRLTYENTLCPLKPSMSGFEVDTSSTPSSENVAPTRLRRNASMSLRLEALTPLRKTRSSTFAGASYPKTLSSSPTTVPASPTTASVSESSTTSASPASPIIASSSLASGSASPGTSSVAAGSSTQTYSSGSRKRRSDQVMSESSDTKKLRKAAQALHPAVQSAIYAAERLSTGAWIKCAVGIVLLDNVLYPVIYDRQSPLAARGFDFIANLPYFVVLSLILQRLQSCHWDTIAFPPTPEVRFTLKEELITTMIDGREFQFKTADASTLYVLNGRGTTGVPVTEIKKAGALETEDRLFLKMSWPETVRRRESEIIERIREVSKEHPLVVDHTPNLLVSAILTIHSTSNIRALLRLNRTDKDCSRVLCCAVFERLSPITELKGMDFWKAYWEIVATHHTLWKKGIEHCDISISNMMVRRKNGGLKGVLNDYDLARLRTSGGCKRAHANDRTGTIPFMAIDLLAPGAGEGMVHHLYRHDLESFAWVLFWILSCYDGGEEVSPMPEPFKGCHVSARIAYLQKSTFLHQEVLEPQQSWKMISSAAKLIKLFWGDFHRRKTADSGWEDWEQDMALVDEDEQGSVLTEKGELQDMHLLQELLAFLASSHRSKTLRKEVLQHLPALS